MASSFRSQAIQNFFAESLFQTTNIEKIGLCVSPPIWVSVDDELPRAFAIRPSVWRYTNGAQILTDAKVEPGFG